MLQCHYSLELNKRNSFTYMHHIVLICLCADRHLRWFHFLTALNRAIGKADKQVSLWEDLQSSGLYPGLVQLVHVVSVCSFLRNHPTDLHGNDHTSSFPRSPPACCHFFPSDWNDAESQTILICISLVTKNADHFFKSLLVICFLLLRFLNVYFCMRACVLFYEGEHTETSPCRPLLGTVWCPLSIWRWTDLFWALTNPYQVCGQSFPGSMALCSSEHFLYFEETSQSPEIPSVNY